MIAEISPGCRFRTEPWEKNIMEEEKKAENNEIQPDTSGTGLKKCSDCGKDVSSYATSCPNCGAPQNPTIRKCPDCGKDVSIHATSCPNCGRPLEPAARTDLKPVNMGFSLQALPLIILLCSWLSTKEFECWSATSFFVFIFAVFIGIEAYRNRKIKDIGNPFAWILGALFFYPIVYPYYIFKRKEIQLDSIFKLFSIPLAILTLYFWIVSFNTPGAAIGTGSLTIAAPSGSSSYSSGSTFSSPEIKSEPASSREEYICREAKNGMTEFLSDMEGSRAPSCTSVTIVKKVSSTKWIGKAVTDNGKSGEINIEIMGFGDDDPEPVVMVMPVDITDFYNPFK